MAYISLSLSLSDCFISFMNYLFCVLLCEFFVSFSILDFVGDGDSVGGADVSVTASVQLLFTGPFLRSQEIRTTTTTNNNNTDSNEIFVSM